MISRRTFYKQHAHRHDLYTRYLACHYSPFLIELLTTIQQDSCSYITEIGAALGTWSSLLPKGDPSIHLYEENVMMLFGGNNVLHYYCPYNRTHDITDIIFSSRYLNRMKKPEDKIKNHLSGKYRANILHHVLSPSTKEELFYGEILRTKEQWQTLVNPDSIIEFPGSYILKWRKP